ncbi:MAG TPA: IS4 family transposase [Longimicrobiaceae bacterium]
MVSVSRALTRIKADLSPHLPDGTIEAACREAGHKWRERKLGPVATLHLFVLQVLHFNTAIRHLRHLAGEQVNAAAYCRARMRLPPAAVQALLRSSSGTMRRGAGALWHGLRAFLVDGSSVITPDTPALGRAFGHPERQTAGCGFPVAKVLGLFDAFTGMVVEALGLPLCTHDQSKVWTLHPLLGAGDLLVGDCGLCSYAHLAMLRARDVLACFRMHQRQGVDFRPHRKAGGRGRPKSRFVRRLGRHDQLVDWVKPKRRPRWMTEAQFRLLPATLPVREVRYRIPRVGQRTLCVTIATTLLDAKRYPAGEVAALYESRWRVETHFAELKTALGMRKLACKTEAGILKELAVYCLVYNLVHAVMARAAARQATTPDRVSFIDALRWLLAAAPGEDVPDLVTNPPRPGRHEPRARKDRGSGHPFMTKPRAELRKALRRKNVKT